MKKFPKVEWTKEFKDKAVKMVMETGFRKYPLRQEAIMEITEYIELFYNRQRIQAKLDFLSPIGYLTK